MTEETIGEAFDYYWQEQLEKGRSHTERMNAEDDFIEGIRWLSRQYNKHLPEIKKQAAREGYIAAAMYFGYPQVDQLTAAECAEGWSNYMYGGDDDE